MSQSNVGDRYETVQAFHFWMRDTLISTGHPEDGQFLPCDLVSAHLEANNYEILNNLISDVYSGQISAKEVVSAYSKVFCILISIGKSDFLPSFMHCDDLNDSHLPFQTRECPRRFPVDTNDLGFFATFCSAQWKFCPPMINANCNRRLDSHSVLPFTSKTKIAEGASAKISMIEIYPYYNSLPSLNKTDVSMNIYALKTYQGKDAKKSWVNELQAFQKLGSSGSPNVIGFYTAFQHGNTYHVILEYADRGSLEEYLQVNTPPVDGVEIARFWKRILGLVRGVKDLHGGDEVIWHQDIKPANVLVLSDPSSGNSPYASTFKIADLGTSHSKRITSSDDDGSDPDTQGTRTYGAPECYRSEGPLGGGPRRVTTLVDVFSLGCILSEIAIWIAGKYEYLTEYRQARQKYIEGIPDFHDADCFHNGITMLPIVREWHNKAKDKIAFTEDMFTHKFIPMIEEMLQDARQREDATKFCTKAHLIFAESLEEYRKSYPNRDIPDDVLSSSLRRQRQRTDPPVRPFDNDPLEIAVPTTRPVSAVKNANWPSGFVVNSPELLQTLRTSMRSGQGTLHTFQNLESGSPVFRHHQVASAPIQVPAPVFETEEMGPYWQRDQSPGPPDPDNATVYSHGLGI